MLLLYGRYTRHEERGFICHVVSNPHARKTELLILGRSKRYSSRVSSLAEVSAVSLWSREVTGCDLFVSEQRALSCSMRPMSWPGTILTSAHGDTCNYPLTALFAVHHPAPVPTFTKIMVAHQEPDSPMMFSASSRQHDDGRGTLLVVHRTYHGRSATWLLVSR